MTEKKVIVQLDEETLESLKDAKYSLCFAKKVNDQYNVVWKASKEYLVTNSLSWRPQYEVFGTNTYEESVKVQADTNVVNAELGQQCILTEAGVMKGATSGTHATGIAIINNYGPIHSGISQVCCIAGKEEITPIYVSAEERTIGEILLTPKEKVMVWFEANVETSTIFEDAKTHAIEIDLTNNEMEKVSYNYKDGVWKVLETK